MKTGREALIVSTIAAAQGLVGAQPLCAEVVVHTGYALSIRARQMSDYHVVQGSIVYAPLYVYEPMIVDVTEQAPQTKPVGRVVIRVRDSGMALSCTIPSVDDYELPGGDYSVRRGMLEQELDADTSSLAGRVVEFCRELVLFVRLYCDLESAWKGARA
jgi:hypothetical protein